MVEAPIPANGEIRRLTGFTVGIVADQTREEIVGLISRLGAKVVSSAPIRNRGPSVTRKLMEDSRVFVASTDPGLVISTVEDLSRWQKVADSWGIGTELRDKLEGSKVVQFPRSDRPSLPSIEALLRDGASPSGTPTGASGSPTDTSGFGVARNATLITSGEGAEILSYRLGRIGITVEALLVDQPSGHSDSFGVSRLVHGAISGQLDALVLTSPAATDSLLESARGAGFEQELTVALSQQVLCVAIGTLSAAALSELGAHVAIPERPRVAPLVRLLATQLPKYKTKTLRLSGGAIEIRGNSVLINGQLVTLPPAPMAMIRALSEVPGRVYTRRELAPHLPGADSSTHAVEMAVTRLRSLLPGVSIVQTVVKRGYRLAYDP